MRRGNLFATIVVAALLVAAANWEVERASVNSLPRQLIRKIAAGAPVVDVLGIGDSLVYAGIDPESLQNTFRQAGQPIAVMNAGMAGSIDIEQLALTRVALRSHTVRNLIYGFFDQQMSPGPPLKNSELTGFHAMLYYQEPESTLRYAQFGLADVVAFQVYRRFALLRERGNVWAKVEKTRRAMDQMGMPLKETNQFGFVAQFSEFGDPQEFARRCEEIMRSGNFLSAARQALFREAESSGARVTVVEMPVHPLHAARYYDLPAWKAFRTQDRLAVERAGAAYIDASLWIPDAGDFQDHLHLTAPGAARFSRLLAQELLRRDGNQRLSHANPVTLSSQ